MPDPKWYVFHTSEEGYVPAATDRTLLAALLAEPVEVELLSDLPRLAEARDPVLSRVAESDAGIVAPFAPRAVRSLFAWAGAPLAEDRAILRCVPEELDACMAQALGHASRAGAEHVRRAEMMLADLPDADSPWRAWYPVIDPKRCTHCRQCAGFCLFGVYELADGKVRVARPRKCKNDCPACSRVCPAGAIIFPKYPDPPINGIDAPAPEGSLAGVDLRKLRKEDVLAELRRRSAAAAAAEGQRRRSADSAPAAPDADPSSPTEGSR